VLPLLVKKHLCGCSAHAALLCDDFLFLLHVAGMLFLGRLSTINGHSVGALRDARRLTGVS
jgi:hypothetical protein